MMTEEYLEIPAKMSESCNYSYTDRYTVTVEKHYFSRLSFCVLWDFFSDFQATISPQTKTQNNLQITYFLFFFLVPKDSNLSQKYGETGARRHMRCHSYAWP